jgi:hypothetical protein
MQNRDAEDRHDGRVDVCDHCRAHRSDVGDQGEEEEERDRRAHDRKHRHPMTSRLGTVCGHVAIAKGEYTMQHSAV